MKAFMVLAALVAVAAGQYDYTGPQRQNGGARPVYGPPQREFEEQRPQQPQPLPPQAQPQPQPQQPQQPGQQAEAYTPQTFRHVYVHAAPDEPAEQQARTIRVPGGDKHVNIIFVKTPSQSSQSQTEVILPEQDEHKNLVYVLLKKNEAESNIRIRRPQAQRPQKPEVYFIRYKGQEEQQNGNGNGGYPQGPQNGGSSNQGISQISAGPSPVRQNGNGFAQISSGPAPSRQNGNGFSQISAGPAPTRQNGNGNGFSEAGGYSPAVVPGIIRSPSDVPSSGYGVPL